jgi:hypothetical protein
MTKVAINARKSCFILLLKEVPFIPLASFSNVLRAAGMHHITRLPSIMPAASDGNRVNARNIPPMRVWLVRIAWWGKRECWRYSRPETIKYATAQAYTTAVKKRARFHGLFRRLARC